MEVIFKMQTRSKYTKKSINMPTLYEFCMDNIRSFVIVLVILIVAYGMKIFHLSISHDTEAIINVPDSLYNSWFTMGRFGLIFLKKILNVYVFNPYLASIFMFITMVLNSAVWEYLFYTFTNNKTRFSKRSWVFPVLFFTAPVMAEQVSFLLQAFEVQLAIFFVGLSLLWIWRGVMSGTVWYYIPSIILLALSFSCYQTTVPLFIAATLALFLLNFEKMEQYWKTIFKLILCFFLAFLLYEIINKIIMAVLNISTTSYISDQILWGSESAKECIKNILHHIIDALRAKGIYYSVAFPLSVLLLFYLIYRKRGCKAYYLYILASIALLISPFFMTIIIGQIPKFRTQVVLPFVFGFIIQYFIGVMDFKFKKLQVLRWIYCIIFILGMQQSMEVSRMFYSEYVQYEEDVRLALKISDRIDQLDLGESPAEPLIIIGSRAPRLNRSSYRLYENPGHSFFEWSFSTQYGTFIMNNFMSTIGYTYLSPTQEQIEYAETYSKSMDLWPNKSSVQNINGMIIVKLSDI